MSEINTNNDLDEVFEETMDDSTVITVPIDETLTHSGKQLTRQPSARRWP